MNCKEIKKLIYLDKENELNTSEKEILELHLEGCSTCRSLYLIVQEDLLLIKQAAHYKSIPKNENRITDSVMKQINDSVVQSPSLIDLIFNYLLKPQLRYSLGSVSFMLMAFFIYEQSYPSIQKNTQKTAVIKTPNQQQENKVVLNISKFYAKLKDTEKAAQQNSCFSLYKCLSQAKNKSSEKTNDCNDCEHLYQKFQSNKNNL